MKTRKKITNLQRLKRSFSDENRTSSSFASQTIQDDLHTSYRKDINLNHLPNSVQKEEKSDDFGMGMKNDVEDNSEYKEKEEPAMKKVRSEGKRRNLMELVNKLKSTVFVDADAEFDADRECGSPKNGDYVPCASEHEMSRDTSSANTSASETPDKNMRIQDRRCQGASQRAATGKRNFQCDVCGYKAKWLSELQKHKLVHTNEKPFPCPHCSHRSRWKGDLTRHIQKIHKIFVPSQRMRKSSNLKANKEKRLDRPILPANSVPVILQQVPISLNGNFMAFPGMQPTETSTKQEDVGEGKSNCSNLTKSNSLLVQRLNSEPKNIAKNDEQSKEVGNKVESSAQSHTDQVLVKKMVYKCKECSFYTKTASRFHVHVVQHLNKRPYMCSECCYRSNWQWDVTKHIRVKANKMNDHKYAEVLLIDEAGEKNYEKYKPYMQLVEEPQQTSPSKRKATATFSGAAATETEELNTDEEPQVSNQTISNIKMCKELNGYRCKNCGFQSKQKEIVSDHAITHLAKYVMLENINKCCKKIDASQPMFSTKGVGEEEAFVCANCPFITHKKELINFHCSQHSKRPEADFQCFFCPFWVTLESNLLKHINLHVKNPELFVKKLDELVVKEEGNENVEEIVNGEISPAKKNEFGCIHCSYKSSNITEYLDHQQLHADKEKKVHQCSTCDHTSDSLDLLQEHVKHHEDDEDEDYVHPVKEEEEELTDEKSVVSEEQDDSSQGKQMVKMYKCRYCPLVNKRRANIKTHELMHTKGKGSQYACNFCNYQCDSQGALTSHLKMHEQTKENYSLISEQNFPKDEVQAVYLDKANVPRQRMKQVNNAQCRCSKCPSVFKTVNVLNNHEKLHGSNNQFKCNVCDYAAKFKPHLHNHVKVHLGVGTPDAVRQSEEQSRPKPSRGPNSFHCSKCPAKFSKNIRLRRHEALHGADGKFTCLKCEYSVNNSIAYQKHKQLHSSHEPMEATKNDDDSSTSSKCSELSQQKDITNKFWLQRATEHIRVEQDYLDNRIFACNHCPYTHHRKDAVQNHLRRHVLQLGSFKCPYCDYNVLYDSFLRDHIKMHFSPSSYLSPNIKAQIANVEIIATDLNDGTKQVIFKHSNDYIPETIADLNEDITVDSCEEIDCDFETNIKIKDVYSINNKNMKHELNTQECIKHSENVERMEMEEEVVDGVKVKYMEAIENVSNLDDVFNVINEFLHSGGSVSSKQTNVISKI